MKEPFLNLLIAICVIAISGGLWFAAIETLAMFAEMFHI